MKEQLEALIKAISNNMELGEERVILRYDFQEYTWQAVDNDIRPFLDIAIDFVDRLDNRILFKHRYVSSSSFCFESVKEGNELMIDLKLILNSLK